MDASGTVDTDTLEFDLRARGQGVRPTSSQTSSAAPPPAASPAPAALAGTADFTATAAGRLDNTRTYRVEVAQSQNVTVNAPPSGDSP